jgi:ATP-dependent exoDNAse (exonuclease V) beta subunit
VSNPTRTRSGAAAEDERQQWVEESESAHRERVERERRELFVGMTRARDGLWLGFVR